MKFQSKTEAQIQEERLLPEGEYSFQVSGAEDTESKKGNDMIAATVRVFKPDGTFLLVTDYLLESMLYKILHFCEATGLQEEYSAGTLEAKDLIGKTGMLKLGIQKSDGYPDKNVVKDYIVEGKADIPQDAIQKLVDNKVDIDEDSIPF